MNAAADPAAVYDQFMRVQAPASRDQRRWTPADGPIADFDAWAADALARGDLDTLMNYRSLAPGVLFAHPTVEHYTPMFVTLGAATDAEVPVRTTIKGYRFGLSKRSFQVS